MKKAPVKIIINLREKINTNELHSTLLTRIYEFYTHKQGNTYIFIYSKARYVQSLTTSSNQMSRYKCIYSKTVKERANSI